MLTYEDCIGIANLDKSEVAQIAAHERLPYMAALEKGADLLNHPWGDAAIRQMVWDNLCAVARRNDPGRTDELLSVFRLTCLRHPNPCDRRHSPVRATHPVWRG